MLQQSDNRKSSDFESTACSLRLIQCSENVTEFSLQLTQQHDNRSALFADFKNLMEIGQQMNLAQMEVNIARTRVRLASNQVKLARAFL